MKKAVVRPTPKRRDSKNLWRTGDWRRWGEGDRGRGWKYFILATCLLSTKMLYIGQHCDVNIYVFGA
jgi:hypothetical protein